VQRDFRVVESALAERDMVDRLPEPSLVAEKREALRAARKQLDDQQKVLVEDATGQTKTLGDLNRELLARRERAEQRYRDIKADFDSLMSYYNIAIDEVGKAPLDSARHKRLQAEADRMKKKLDELETELNKRKSALDAIETEYREKVRGRLDSHEKQVADAEDQLKKVTGAFDRYAKVAVQRSWTFGDTFRDLPILDGFESPTKIKQIWLPDLTIDSSFKEVPRFARCTSCHLGIDRAAYTKAALTRLGDEKESARLTGKLTEAQKMLERRQAAGEKLGFEPKDMPGERTAPLGLLTLLMLASALVAAGGLALLERSVRVGVKILTAGLVLTLASSSVIALMAPVRPKVKEVKLSDAQVTQYCVHPRMDLFVDSNSPHPMEKFGCTICHSGQGSATEFVLAAHT